MLLTHKTPYSEINQGNEGSNYYVEIVDRAQGYKWTWRSSRSVEYNRNENVETLIGAMISVGLSPTQTYQALSTARLINGHSWAQINASHKRICSNMKKYNETQLKEIQGMILEKIRLGVKVLYVAFDGQYSNRQLVARIARHNTVPFIIYLSDGTKYIFVQEFQDKTDGPTRSLFDENETVISLEKINIEKGLNKIFKLDILIPIFTTDGCAMANCAIGKYDKKWENRKVVEQGVQKISFSIGNRNN